MKGDICPVTKRDCHFWDSHGCVNCIEIARIIPNAGYENQKYFLITYSLHNEVYNCPIVGSPIDWVIEMNARGKRKNPPMPGVYSLVWCSEITREQFMKLRD